MSERLNEERTAEIAARVAAAKAELGRLIDGAPFRMYVPARDTDSDVVVDDALNGVKLLLAEVSALKAENAALRGDLREWNAFGKYLRHHARKKGVDPNRSATCPTVATLRATNQLLYGNDGCLVTIFCSKTCGCARECGCENCATLRNHTQEACRHVATPISRWQDVVLVANTRCPRPECNGWIVCKCGRAVCDCIPQSLHCTKCTWSEDEQWDHQRAALRKEADRG